MDAGSSPGDSGIIVTGPHWIKSSRCAGNGACVEVASRLGGEIWVRDGKDPAGGAILAFSAEEWRTFLVAAAAGDFTR
jgi:hypothetical protein